MTEAKRKEGAGLSYREAGPADGPVALLLHGFPETSRMWVPLMERLARDGRRAVAPDLYDMGEPEPRPPSTFERSLEDVTRFHQELDLGRVALVVHDWGGFPGLAWACDHPDQVEAIVMTGTGFFSDGRWHAMASALRTPGQGEQVVEAMNRDVFEATMKDSNPNADPDAIDEYWKGLSRRPELMLEFYRSMDFEKLARWDGKLAEVPAPKLALWGADDQFSPVSSARRFEREAPGTRVEVLEGAGHFLYEDQPERAAEMVAEFLTTPDRH